MASSVQTRRAVGIAGIAALFGVKTNTAGQWLRRYGTQKTMTPASGPRTHPCPEPDTWIDGAPGWTLPDREQEWRDWDKNRPGQGAKGTHKPGRPRNNP